MMRDALGSDPRLSYGYDEEMYTAPMRTLFAYQAQLARTSGSGEVWVTGTVPLGDTPAAQAAWGRYESAVNEALGSFPFRALCTYDVRERPAEALERARASHPTMGTGLTSSPCQGFVPPSDFLSEPVARVPRPPATTPCVVTVVTALDSIAEVRRLVRDTGRTGSAISREAIDDLVLAVDEVVANGVVHGAPPVWLAMWVDVAEIMVEVVDSGAGGLDPLTGFHVPDPSHAAGLWIARQQVSDLFIGEAHGGGCRVLLVQS